MYAYAGALLWVCTFVFIGYHFGESWRPVLALVEKNLRVASAAGVAILAVFAGWRYLRRK
jgi:membrane protein DedA with SNARE-associated domain